mmetsp:Transcript_19415/g.28772  ORF Transcript_19415/g.28772 Transcript_19415/m.28772 type:complete len:297 (+) Transcript_19415:76-966(+)
MALHTTRKFANFLLGLLWLSCFGIDQTIAFTTKTAFDSASVIKESRLSSRLSWKLSSSKKDVEKEVAELLSKAKAIRDSLPAETQVDNPIIDESSNNESMNDIPSIGYRLHIDIGREDGTWMDRTWGSSGRRIEFTVDVSFLLPNNDDNTEDSSLAPEDVCSKMVKDNLSGKSTAIRIVQCPSNLARLRGGFDQMRSNGGGYRIDLDSKKGNWYESSTARFFLDVEGTKDGEYGDISIPAGSLYFSLPCFQRSIQQLSTREGIVTVQQMGWNTGWRRRESRIVGTFRAVPLQQHRH